jgi:hypothetical protein
VSALRALVLMAQQPDDDFSGNDFPANAPSMSVSKRLCLYPVL